MIVGTASNSGKSLFCASLCRYFSNKGLNVSPFKAQNMSLNSFVTKDGGEMGRAQVVQAMAARREPHTDMNPVLLKPLGDSTSQVIINGKARMNCSARDYYTQKDSISKEAFETYDNLCQSSDIVILEGAGSPTEINLLNEDFVNMRMAEYANASTILVADIDRGGVFASIYGTIKLLPEKWQKLIKGIVINKFRGDESLLESGIKQIEELTRIPVLGVMPFVNGLNIEEEDSLGLENRNQNDTGALLDVAVIRLPKMSNYTDFLSLETAPEMNVRYVENARKLGTPDLLIIPGSKNTISDMRFIRESGFEIKIRKLHDKEVPIIGICGGYQILGELIRDHAGVEGERTEIAGLGLLPVSTSLQAQKELAQVKGHTTDRYPFADNNTELHGYEIHAGATSMKDSEPCIEITKRREGKVSEAAGTASGNTFGCYVHGFFDSVEIKKQLISHLLETKGLADGIAIEDAPHTQDESLDHLAKVMSKSIDMLKIEAML